MRKRSLWFVVILGLPGCGPTPMTSLPATGVVSYRCVDGRQVLASYPDRSTAKLRFDGQTHTLHVAISASGARYVGEYWQWWTRGMHEGRLAPLAPGETIATAAGVSCTAR